MKYTLHVSGRCGKGFEGHIIIIHEFHRDASLEQNFRVASGTQVNE